MYLISGMNAPNLELAITCPTTTDGNAMRQMSANITPGHNREGRIRWEQYKVLGVSKSFSKVVHIPSRTDIMSKNWPCKD